MSWTSYIDQLLGCGAMYCSINGHDGSLWASSPGFTVGADECAKLAAVLESGDFSSISGVGFKVAYQNYTFTRGESDQDEDKPALIQGRCKEEGKSSQGVIIFRTTQALVIGVHDPAYSNGNSFGKLNTDLGRIADHLYDTGF